MISRDIHQNLLQNSTTVYAYEFVHETLIARPYVFDGWNRKFIILKTIKFQQFSLISAVYHAEELWFLFLREDAWTNTAVITNADRNVADMLGKFWTDFAKTGYANFVFKQKLCIFSIIENRMAIYGCR